MGGYCVYFIKAYSDRQVTCTILDVSMTILQAIVQNLWSNKQNNPCSPP